MGLVMLGGRGPRDEHVAMSPELVVTCPFLCTHSCGRMLLLCLVGCGGTHQLSRLNNVESTALRLQRKLDAVRDRQCELLSKTLEKGRKYLVQSVRRSVVPAPMCVHCLHLRPSILHVVGPFGYHCTVFSAVARPGDRQPTTAQTPEERVR